MANRDSVGVEAGFGRPTSPGGETLFGNRRFLLLWTTHAVSQAAHNAVLFTLLIIVTEETGSTTHSSLLVLSFILPAVAFGLVAGVLIDRSATRTVLVFSNLGRAGVCVAYLLVGGNVWAIYGLTVGFSALSQFFNPAVAAVIPTLVSRRQLMAANGLFNVTLTGSQFAGMVILAPVLLKSFGQDVVFVAALLLYVAAALLLLAIPRAQRRLSIERAATATGRLLGDMRADSRRALGQLRSDRTASLAMGQLTLGSSLILLIAVLIPIYMNDVLRISAENAAFVFAPAGLGAAVGLRLLPSLAGRYSRAAITVAGLASIMLGLLLVAAVEPVGALLNNSSGWDPFGPDRDRGLAVLVGLTMSGAIPVGLGYALVNASAQTVLHEHAPPTMRGRYFSTQIALANAISIPPIVLIGALSDLVGVTPMIAALAAVVAVSLWYSRRALPPRPAGRPDPVRQPRAGEIDAGPALQGGGGGPRATGASGDDGGGLP